MQQSENQDKNIEEDWHVSDTSTQLGMIDFEAQSQAAKQNEWNTYGGWTSIESLIHDSELVNETPVTTTNNERSKRRSKLMTSFGNPIPSLLPNLIQHTDTDSRSTRMEGKSGHLLNVTKRGVGSVERV